jgi:hypothetical protein
MNLEVVDQDRHIPSGRDVKNLSWDWNNKLNDATGHLARAGTYISHLNEKFA